MTNCTVKTEEVDIDLLLKKNDLAAAKVSRSLFGTCDCWLFFLTRLYCVPCVFFFLRERNFVLMMLVAQFVHGLYSILGGFYFTRFFLVDSQTCFCVFQNGGRILFATDDGFAVAENLLKVFCFPFFPQIICLVVRFSLQVSILIVLAGFRTGMAAWSVH